jgi:hypothetical protein
VGEPVDADEDDVAVLLRFGLGRGNARDDGEGEDRSREDAEVTEWVAHERDSGMRRYDRQSRM